MMRITIAAGIKTKKRTSLVTSWYFQRNLSKDRNLLSTRFTAPPPPKWLRRPSKIRERLSRKNMVWYDRLCLHPEEVLAHMVEVSFLGHSCIKLRGKKLTIIIDPSQSVKKVESDIVLLTQNNEHHANLTSISPKDGKSPFVISGPGEYEISGCQIVGLATLAKESPEGKGTKNTIYQVALDGLCFLHLGSLYKKLEKNQVEQLSNVEVLMIPVGGGYVLEPKDAPEVIAQLEPKVVVPIHYLEGNGNLPLKELDKFLKQEGADQKTALDKLQLTREKLPEETEIVVLKKV